MKFLKGKLCDPIQVEEIKIDDFSITDKTNSKNLDFTHNEAVLFEKFYWDSSKKCILTQIPNRYLLPVGDLLMIYIIIEISSFTSSRNRFSAKFTYSADNSIPKPW